NFSRCAQAGASGNCLRGQSQYEQGAFSELYSIRGIKMTSCAVSRIVNNTTEDYATPIKVDNGFESLIMGNVCRNNSGVTGNHGDASIALSNTLTNSFGHVVMGNVIENSYSTAMLINNNNGSVSAKVQAQIIGNRIKGCQNNAINI